MRVVTNSLTAKEPRLHLGFLDSLRGLAILMVLAVHASGTTVVIGSYLNRLAMMGQRGVELFYMVSAFTLFLSLDRANPGPRPLTAFYLRRFFRIAPAFYFVMLAELIAYRFHSGNLYRYALAALFVNAWFPKAINLSIVGCWSVAVECTFYLFVPWLHALIRTLRAALAWFAMAALLLVPTSYALSRALPALAEYFQLFWFPVQVPVFLLGIVAYMMWKELGVKAAISDENRSTWGTLLLATATLIFLSNVELTTHHLLFNLRLVPSAISFVFLILAGSVWEWPVLFNRATRFLGRISYSMYLAHFFLLWAYRQRFPVPPAPWLRGPLGTLIIFCVLLVVMTPISYLMWRLIEQPGVRLGRAVIQRIEHRATLPGRTIADRAGL